MTIQIPVKVDAKHRVTIPKEIWRKINAGEEVLVEYDMSTPNVVHIVIPKKKGSEDER
jgi:bifunctional DNA-binding transcriptional regulator/antitoxin component of YhaV-PrlF toxin-antitoxin module